MLLQRNTESRSCKHCCREKAINITNSEYVFYSLWCPACNARTSYCHLWSVPLYSIFPPYLTNGTIKKILNIKCIFCFYLQHLAETFLLLRRTERDMAKIVIGLHVKYMFFYPILMKLAFSGQIPEIYSNSNIRENISSCRRVFPYGQTDGWADRYDEANNRFSKFCNHT